MKQKEEAIQARTSFAWRTKDHSKKETHQEHLHFENKKSKKQE